MTAERIAELRRLTEEWECGIDPALASELAHTIPELLDELEAAQAHAVRLRQALEFGRNNIDVVMRALADTEAAATTWLEAHDREQRLAGARAYDGWLVQTDQLMADVGHRIQQFATLKAIQREARQ